MQLHFKFDSNTDYSEENFFVAKNNTGAYNFATEKVHLSDNYRFFAIVGSVGSGKSHLASIFAHKIGAKYITLDQEICEDELPNLYRKLSNMIQYNRYYIIEDVENFDENLLLYIINIVESKKAKLLIISRTPLTELNFTIEDLKSRIQNFIIFEIGNPDKELIKAIIIKNLSDKQIVLDSTTIEYMMPRVQRSYHFINKFINKLEHLKNTEDKKITIFTIKKVFDALEK